MTIARDLMTTTVVTVDASLSLRELDDALLREGVSGAPVVEQGRLVGVVSGSDVIRELSAVQESADEMVAAYYQEPPFRGVIARGYLPKESESVGRGIAARCVRDVMSTRIISVSSLTPAVEIAKQLIRYGIHRVLVTEGDKLLGIISSLDLVQLMAEPGTVQAARARSIQALEDREFFTPDLAGERRGGAEVATLRDDLDGGATTLLVRLPPGGRIEAHTHSAPVQHYVLSGEYESDGRLFKAGTYRFLPKPEIAPITSERGAVVLLIYDARPI